MIEVAEKTKEERVEQSPQAIIDEIKDKLGDESGPFLCGLLTGLKARGELSEGRATDQGAERQSEQTEAVKKTEAVEKSDTAEIDVGDVIVREARLRVQACLDNYSEDVQEQAILGLAFGLDEAGKRIEPGADDEPGGGILTELVRYVAGKFSAKDKARLYGRFLIEAQAAFAAHTPGNQTTREENLGYVTNHLVSTLGIYTPSYQRKALCKYIKEVLPEADADHDEAAEEALWAQLIGEAERAEGVRDIINVLQEVPTSKLLSAKSKLQKMCDN